MVSVEAFSRAESAERDYLVSVYKFDILSPSPTPPLKGGAILLPSPLRGEGKCEGG